MNIPKETVEQFAFEFWSDGRAEGLSQHEYIAQRAAEWALSQPVSMEPVAKLSLSTRGLEVTADYGVMRYGEEFDVFTADQLAQARQQGAEEERKKRLDWAVAWKELDVNVLQQRIAELEKSNAQLLEALKKIAEGTDSQFGNDAWCGRIARTAIKEVKP